MRRSTTILLSIIALALVVIAVRPTPKADAQPQVQIAPSVTGIAVAGSSTQANAALFRIWSDGLVEKRSVAYCVNLQSPYFWTQSEWSTIQEACP